MNLRFVSWVMSLLMLPGLVAGMAAAWAVWETLRGHATWGTVGQLVLLTVAFVGPALLLDQFGRSRSGGRVDWWQEDQLAAQARPKPGARPSDLGAYATLGLKQTVASLRPGIDVRATDRILKGYRATEGIDWHDVWQEASRRGPGAPPYAAKPYWVAKGPGGSMVPKSVLAFCGASTRSQIAADRSLDERTRALLARDPSSVVRQAAGR